MSSHSTTHKGQPSFWTPLRKQWAFRLGMGVVALGVAGGFALLVFAAWVSKDLPDPNSLSMRNVAQSTKIYDRTGKVLLYEIYGDEQRTLVPIDQIPKTLQHATVAIEDRKFYEHHGVDWLGLVRAVIRNAVKFQGPKGTSTLTQQLVRNTIIANERNYLRKLKEIILALQIERTYTKDQVLQLYLNEVPYGSTLYGVEAAAQAYFGKSARELTLDESALLASIPQAPDRLSPYGTGVRGDNRPQLLARQDLVLEKMAEQGYITSDEAKAAQETDTLAKLKPQRVGSIKAPHFVTYVRGLLAEQFAEQGGIKYVEQSGLRVITSLDWERQQVAEKTVQEAVEKRGPTFQFNNASLVAIDPKNGELLSMVGSADFFNKAIDGQVNVTLTPQQPGSSFKPIIYVAAFMKGLLPETEIYDTVTTFPTDSRPYEPLNYNLREYGPVTLRKALAGSLNIPAVKLQYIVGVGRALDFAEQLGYSTFTAENRSRFGLALVLGAGEVTPLDHAHAYAAFANDGVQQPLHPILRVESSDGKTLFAASTEPGTRLIDEQSVRLLNDILTDNEARTYIFGSRNSLTLPDRQVAAKTGTTNDYTDAWTMGYTPNLVTAVWVGNTNNKAMKRGADSSSTAAPIWQTFMREATKDRPKDTFPEPQPPTTDRAAVRGNVLTKRVRIDTSTGLLATEFTPPNQIEERTYLEPHDLLHFMDKDDPLGEPPTNPATDPQYGAWEAGVRSWIERTNATTTQSIPQATSDQYGPEFAPTMTVLEPQNQQIVTGSFLPIRVEAQAPRGVREIRVRFADQELGSVTNAPWNFGTTIPATIPDGFYDLVLTARDDVGNASSQTVTVSLQRSVPIDNGAAPLPINP